MFSCRDVAETASDYLERDLSRFDRLKFRAHLLLCQSCRRYVEQIARTAVLLRLSLGAAPITPEIEDRVVAAVRAGPDLPRPDRNDR